MLDKNIVLYQHQIGCSIYELVQKVSLVMKDTSVKRKVTYRIKNAETLRKKIFLKKVENVFSIHDVYGIRIVVESINDIYLIFEKIKTQIPVYLANDFIKNPIELYDYGFKGKYFRCLRLVAYENNIAFEIQITTKKFHEVNESHHEIYHRKIYQL